MEESIIPINTLVKSIQVMLKALAQALVQALAQALAILKVLAILKAPAQALVILTLLSHRALIYANLQILITLPIVNVIQVKHALV